MWRTNQLKGLERRAKNNKRGKTPTRLTLSFVKRLPCRLNARHSRFEQRRSKLCKMSIHRVHTVECIHTDVLHLLSLRMDGSDSDVIPMIPKIFKSHLILSLLCISDFSSAPFWAWPWPFMAAESLPDGLKKEIIREGQGVDRPSSVLANMSHTLYLL